MPGARLYSKNGYWLAEGQGIEPNIPVTDDPTQLAKGVDPKLERAIREVQRLIEENPR